MNKLTTDDELFLKDMLNVLTEQRQCTVKLGKVSNEPQLVIFHDNEDPELFNLDDIADIIRKLS